jgi:hypothetical protein
MDLIIPAWANLRRPVGREYAAVRFRAISDCKRNGAARGIRTPDPVITKREFVLFKQFIRERLIRVSARRNGSKGFVRQAVYQLSGTPKNCPELRRILVTATEM